MKYRDKHVGSISTGTLHADPIKTVLGHVNVNTGVLNAVLTLRHKDASGAIIAVIDAGSKSSHTYEIIAPEGVYFDLAAGAADVTVSYA